MTERAPRGGAYENRGCVVVGATLMFALGVCVAVAAVGAGDTLLRGGGMYAVGAAWASMFLVPIAAMTACGNAYTARRCTELPKWTRRGAAVAVALDGLASIGLASVLFSR